MVVLICWSYIDPSLESTFPSSLSLPFGHWLSKEKEEKRKQSCFVSSSLFSTAQLLFHPLIRLSITCMSFSRSSLLLPRILLVPHFSFLELCAASKGFLQL